MKELLWCLCLGISMAAYGQSKAVKPKIVYKNTIILSPLSLIDVDRTLLVGSEYRFNQKWSVVTDAGYTFSSYYISNNKKTSGFTLRPSLRKYTGKRNEFFWQTQLLYKQVTYLQKDWFGKDCVNEVPSYEQYGEFKFRKKVYGINIMTGEIITLSNNLFLEIVAGAGVRWKRHMVVGEGNSCYRTNTVSTINSYRPKTTTVSLPVSLRLVYKLK